MRKKKNNTDNKKINKFIFWTPRILSILFLLFLALFSLDVFNEDLAFWNTILALIIHNIPALVLLIILLIAWKYEMVGAIAFILAGLFYAIMILTNNPFEWHMISWIATIALPAFLIGGLFLLGWYQKRKRHSKK